MQEVRCEKCNKLLYGVYPDQERFRNKAERASFDIKHFALNGHRIECKCPKCGHMNISKEANF